MTANGKLGGVARDEEAIRVLAMSTGAPADEVRALFTRESTRLEVDPVALRGAVGAPVPDEVDRMAKTQHASMATPRAMCVLLLLGATVTASSQNDSTVATPLHARSGGFGSHPWECLRGYRQENNACLPVNVPANGYLDASGYDWSCDRGYQKSGNACTLTRIPTNAHGDDRSYGSGWECNRGYREIDGGCTRIVIPPHAYADSLSYGPGWRCERGYRAEGQTCAAVKIPAKGFLTSEGDDWECAEGFSRQGNACVSDP